MFLYYMHCTCTCPPLYTIGVLVESNLLMMLCMYLSMANLYTCTMGLCMHFQGFIETIIVYSMVSVVLIACCIGTFHSVSGNTFTDEGSCS